jgi:hypothetical protein
MCYDAGLLMMPAKAACADLQIAEKGNPITSITLQIASD